MRFNKVHVIINPASGNDEPILNTLNDVFKQYDIDWDASITHADGDGARHAQEAIAKGCDLIMTYGGDGTVLDVAEGMLESDVPLAILPGGTANAMADELNVPSNLAQAAAIPFASAATIRKVDVGKAGERYFLLRVGTGIVASISEEVTRDLKDRFGIAAYLIGGIQALTNPQFVTYRLNIDGTEIETQGTACLITNGNSLGVFSLKLSPQVKIDDGLLDVFILNNDVQTVLGALSNLAQIENSLVKLQHWQGKSIIIDAEPEQGIYGDGENIAFTNTPCTIELHQAALKIVTIPVEEAT